MASNSPVPSWNDPPALKFDAIATSSKPRLLNKRVFTLLDKHGEPSSMKESNEDRYIPPNISETTLLVVNDHAIPINNQKEAEENCDAPSSDSEIFAYVSETLKSCLIETPQNCERTIKEIERRLSIMEKSWDSELSMEVKHMMFKLAQALRKGNIDAALKIHCSLMVQNVREVKNWMVGVKKIIELRKENLNSPSMDENLLNCE